MKKMKKIATLILALCLTVSCFTLPAYAADGRIMFSDPETEVGKTVEVMGVIQRSQGNFGKIEITMTYDTGMLKFKSGDGVTESTAGTITYSGDATRDGDRKEFVMKFDALKAGTTVIRIKSSTIKNVSGSVMDYEEGTSTIKIAQGNGTTTATPGNVTDATVEVNGESYRIADGVPQNEIPEGYEAATLEYDMVEYNVVYSESTGLYLAYLVNEENGGRLFMYVEEDATFAPFAQIAISDKVTITLLSDVSDIILPSEYKVTEVVLGDQTFPAWQNTANPNLCILYAINSNGEKSLYQLDNDEGTYQRFTAPEVVFEKEDNSWIGKLSSSLENHLDRVILVTGLGFLLFILIIIILSVKLYNRNAELDEIYEEYGIEDKEGTEDDVILDLDENEDDDDGAEDEIELYGRNALHEVFPEETVDEVSDDAGKIEENQGEDSLGKVLEEQKNSGEKSKADIFDDDDDFFANFSVDFIDLDDEE